MELEKKKITYTPIDHLDPKVIDDRLPGMSLQKRFRDTKDPIPVVPTVHYNMGGILLIIKRGSYFKWI